MTLFYYFAKQLEVEIEVLIQGKNEPRFFCEKAGCGVSVLYICSDCLCKSRNCVKNKKVIRTLRQFGSCSDYYCLVPVVGVEPTRYRYHGILSPARLPIPSHRQFTKIFYHKTCTLSIPNHKNFNFN